jgi:hypothetical protein
MGYADISCGIILAHLQTTYGIVTAEDLEENRKKLTDPWNPDWPQEDLWIRIKTTQTFAAANHDPITDAVAISLTLTVFEKATMYHDQTVGWRNRDNTGATLAMFQEHFTINVRENCWFRARHIAQLSAGSTQLGSARSKPLKRFR